MLTKLEKIEGMLDYLKGNAQFFNNIGVFSDDMRKSLASSIHDHDERRASIEKDLPLTRN